MMALQKKLKKAKSLEDLIVLGKEYRDYSAGKFLINSLSELKDLLSLNNNDSLSREEIQHLQLMLDQNLDKVLSEQEEYLPVLGTSAAVSPLIGLFGTVWGLIHAFVSISQQRSADLAVLAPGIAEALTTTLAGLIVAIPSLIFFYYFTNELRKIEQKLWVVSDRFLMVVKNTFI
jgi:biopolymer transport protein TolQ